MKILLSAYACEPGKGSEPAVGWNWMLALIERGEDVSVVTRENNRTAIEEQIQERGLNVTPIYYDLPAWCRRWKRWPGGLYLYYLLWQFGAYRRVRKIHRIAPFDVVHHITFVTCRQPSFMGGLGIPFLLGPVGGGETSPRSLRAGMNLSGRLREMLRDLAVAAARFDPLMDRTFSQASLIACTTSETMRRIPSRYRDKCLVLPAIGIAIPEAFSPPEPAPSPTFLFAGRLLYWKGLHLALRAMPEVLRHAPNARLKIVGEGRDARWLKRVAEECGVAGSVDWIPRIEHREMAALYRGHAAIVFPSLHDSGGMVVLESLAAQVPVICLALGGPGMFVDSLCGISIDPAGQTEEEIQHALASAMIQLAQQPAMRNALAAHCLGRALQFTWRGSADHFYTAWETMRAPRKVPARA